MKMIRSRDLAAVAVAALLSLPTAALAQSGQAPATAAPTVTPPATATSQTTAEPAPVKNAEERVERRITELRAQLHITAAEQQPWDQFAQVMRQNARDMDQVFVQRAQQYPSMTAVQNMQSYAQIAEVHAQQLQKLVPAFQNLYNSMSDQQKQAADQVFRANAENHAKRQGRKG